MERTPCELHCKPDHQYYSEKLLSVVTDGTPCRPGTRDMCINGLCKRVSCDWSIDGTAQEDRCGLCHGDGTQCVTHRGEWRPTGGSGYQPATQLPVGARNVRVSEEGDTHNYLALYHDAAHRYLLNGNLTIQWSGEYSLPGGGLLHYKREVDIEELFLPGPLTATLTLMVLLLSPEAEVRWEYTLPHVNASYTPSFEWQMGEWSVCSRSCGGGDQAARAQCMEQEAGLVEDKYCLDSPKPPTNMRVCNTHDCPAWWWTGPWQPCSVTCGPGGTTRRTVICVRSLGATEQMALLDSDCPDADKPHDTEPCTAPESCPTDLSWSVGPWLQTCGGDPCATERRLVECLLPDEGCDVLTRPPHQRRCGNITCGTWTVGPWTQCSSACGEGVEVRQVSCEGGLACELTSEPRSARECEGPCDAEIQPPTALDILNMNIPPQFNEIASSSMTTQHPTPKPIKLGHHNKSSTINETLNTATSYDGKKTDFMNEGYHRREENNTRNSESLEIDENNRSDTTGNMSSEIEINAEVLPAASRHDKATAVVTNTNNSEADLDANTNDPSSGIEHNIVEGSEGSQGNTYVGDTEDDRITLKVNINEGNESIATGAGKHMDDSINPDDNVSRILGNGSHNAVPHEHSLVSPNTARNSPATKTDKNQSEISSPELVLHTTISADEPVSTSTEPLPTQKIDSGIVLEYDFMVPSLNSESHDEIDSDFNGSITPLYATQNTTNSVTVTSETRGDIALPVKSSSTSLSRIPTIGTNSSVLHTSSSFKPSKSSSDADAVSHPTKNPSHRGNPETSPEVNALEYENDDIVYEYDPLDDTHKIHNDVFEYDSDTHSQDGTSLGVSRPQGIAEDKINVDDFEIVEVIRAPANEKKRHKNDKHHKRRRKKYRQKLVVHEGEEAIALFNDIVHEHGNLRHPDGHGDLNQILSVPLHSWSVGNWGNCSAHCDGGVQKRIVQCQEQSTGGVVGSVLCASLPAPQRERPCNLLPCLDWTVSPWSACSAECGHGHRHRSVTCASPNMCKEELRAPSMEPCTLRPCVVWSEGPWSMCTKTCGVGYQIRAVRCVEQESHVHSALCPTDLKPPHKRSCNEQPCAQNRQGQVRQCRDRLDTQLCRRLVHMCTTKFFRAKCCRTCWKKGGRGEP
ncbi:uncharacterized protein LOC108665385 [Hyalella azteca]|uniref:Uncharacterized protein LOC108665385 n=1 Tax=Hyalella azteca TaxID=294128 RepID=A0A8B7N227_HYAAZ|nr:uncharacterized protein LOC108665385 [Hyalella azteca]